MKVYFGKYKNRWNAFSWQQDLLEWLLEKNYISEKTENIIEKYTDPVFYPFQWLFDLIYNNRSWANRKEKVRIDYYDTWNMDYDLALIIHPLLVNLKVDKMGAPVVADEDVPEELRSTAARPLTEEEKNIHSTDDNFFKRFDYVLDEMIWAFNSIIKEADMRENFWIDGEIDAEKMNAWYDRQHNGLRLFGKYFRDLWS